MASVVLFRLPDARYSRVIERLETVLPASAEALATGAVVIVEPARHRTRELPNVQLMMSHRFVLDTAGAIG